LVKNKHQQSVYLRTIDQNRVFNSLIYTYMGLGEKIKLVRMQKKMSQSDLAKAADVHQKNISKYENDGVVPSALILKEIAKALGVTADFLLGSDLDDIIKVTTK